MADGAVGDLVDEGLDHRQRDIGLEQRDPDFAHRRTNIEFGQRAAAAELVENATEAVGETIEQVSSLSNSPATTSSPRQIVKRRWAKPR